MSDQYEHQDWKPVVLRKRKPQLNSSIKIRGPLSASSASSSDGSRVGGSSVATVARQNSRSLAPTKFRLLDGDDAQEMKKAVVKVSRSLGVKISVARASHDPPMAQKDLAARCSVKESVISDFEAGRGAFDSSLLQKINRALGTSFSKKDNQ